ncbi:hypothetical protein KP509_03G067400 [Ceratopteris richardii]|uniref:Uncharacterized protein n=1 Tax=Ceratopteris richardii TaxID=49495 RepID=A0A8T2V805_CERRI|nr:hypothetical protein KP509_03G067400 [Ceratopteris richardii]
MLLTRKERLPYLERAWQIFEVSRYQLAQQSSGGSDSICVLRTEAEDGNLYMKVIIERKGGVIVNSDGTHISLIYDQKLRKPR